MTRKKLTAIPLQSTTHEATVAIDDFPTEIAHINPTTPHFFEVYSVIKATGIRKYGRAPLEDLALEIHCDARNANVL